MWPDDVIHAQIEERRRQAAAARLLREARARQKELARVEHVRLPWCEAQGNASKRRPSVIKGLSTAGIWSEDIQKSLLPFYRDVLGLPLSVDTPGFVVLGRGAAGTPSVTLGTHSEVKGKNMDPARHMVGLATDDIQADVQRLKSRGVEFIAEPEVFDNVTVATFKDPEGNYIQLLQFK